LPLDSWWSECGFSKPLKIATTLRDELVVRGTPLCVDLRLPGAFNEANAAMALTALTVPQR
jgi:UDP-N-acetylmuramyl tripeptide synthase